MAVELVGIKNPSLQKGETAKIAPRNTRVISTYATAVSAQCKVPGIAVRFLNYAYTEEGKRYFNFGIENVSYTMKDGVPTYTPLITKNPDMPMVNALAMYTRASYGGPFVKDAQYTAQYYQDEMQKEALHKWADNEAARYILPTMTVSEDTQWFSARLEEIKKYQREMVTQLMIGEIDMNQYDQFIQTLKNTYGIEEMIEVLQQFYDATQKN